VQSSTCGGIYKCLDLSQLPHDVVFMKHGALPEGLKSAKDMYMVGPDMVQVSPFSNVSEWHICCVLGAHQVPYDDPVCLMHLQTETATAAFAALGDRAADLGFRAAGDITGVLRDDQPLTSGELFVGVAYVDTRPQAACGAAHPCSLCIYLKMHSVCQGFHCYTNIECDPQMLQHHAAHHRLQSSSQVWWVLTPSSLATLGWQSASCAAIWRATKLRCCVL
jgi:hypothetical protein